MDKILVANRWSWSALTHLKNAQLGEVHAAPDFGELQEHWATATALLTRSGTHVDTDLLKKCPKLKVIITATSGFDHLHLKSCAERGITVMHTPQANAISASELAWTLILTSQRKLYRAKMQMDQGTWDRSALIGQELHGKTLGLVGLGRIGQRVARLAQAFEMSVLVYDPYVDPYIEQNSSPQITFLGYEELIRKSDIVSYHVPLTTETKHMINTSTLQWFSETATLVNTSRGELFSYNELISHLQDHPTFHLATDVFPTEPLPKNSLLLKLPNVIYSPHVGATTEQAIERASQEATEKLITYLKTGQATDTLPPSTLWAKKLVD